MLELKDIYKYFQQSEVQRIDAISDLNLKIEKNEWTYLIGGNGSGKSTLLKLIAGEIKPNKGSIIIDGKDITSESQNKRAVNVYYIEQDTKKDLIGSMTVYENLVLSSKSDSIFPDFKLFKRKYFIEKVRKILALYDLGLENRLDTQVRFLSGGEQQSVVVAKIMLRSPDILLLDEFTSALDQKIAPKILDILKDFSIINNVTTILVTHDYSYIEKTGDRVILLSNGKIRGDYHKNGINLTENFILERFYARK